MLIKHFNHTQSGRFSWNDARSEPTSKRINRPINRLSCSPCGSDTPHRKAHTQRPKLAKILSKDRLVRCNVPKSFSLGQTVSVLEKWFTKVLEQTIFCLNKFQIDKKFNYGNANFLLFKAQRSRKCQTGRTSFGWRWSNKSKLCKSAFNTLIVSVQRWEFSGWSRT